MKFATGMMLFATWVALVCFHIAGTDDLIFCIKGALVGLGFYHAGDAAGSRRAAPPFSSATNQ
jgi:hypothetical protein